MTAAPIVAQGLAPRVRRRGRPAAGALCRVHLLLLAALPLASCVTQSIPTHGGGKRFFYEQHLVSASFDRALEQLDLAPLRELAQDRAVTVRVVAMGDEGGGVESSPGFLGVLGLGGGLLPGSGGSGGYVAGVQGTPTDSSSFAFANARDIEYAKGRILQVLARTGVQIARSTSEADFEVYFLIPEFGTAKSTFNLVVYNEAELAARAVVEGFVVEHGEVGDGRAPRYLPLGRGECTAVYDAEYILGTGPIRGASIRLIPGPLPVRIIEDAAPQPEAAAAAAEEVQQ